MSVVANSPIVDCVGYYQILPTVTASAAYTGGDCVGGAQTLSSVCHNKGGAVILSDILAISRGNQKVQYSFLFYGSALAGTYADKTGVALATDLNKMVGKANIATTDYITSGSDSVALANVNNLNILLPNLESTQDLYLVVLTSGTPTYTSVTDLTWYLKFSSVF